MNPAAIIAIAVAVVVVLAAISFTTLGRRSDVRGAGALSRETFQRDKQQRRAAEAEGNDQRETVGAGSRSAEEAEAEGAAARGTAPSTALTVADIGPEIVEWEAPDPEVMAVSRRQFFNRATVTLMSAGLGAFAAASFVGFLWPIGTGGFGGAVNAGKLGTIKENIRSNGGFYYVAEARSWITEYPAEALPVARLVYPANVLEAMERGIVVLSQKCPHLGCRVPECATSQWFECQCHGSQYNRAGEKKAGPAPRGMDRHPTTFSVSDDVVIDTGSVIPGPAIGVNTTGQEAEGPHCTSEGSH